MSRPGYPILITRQDQGFSTYIRASDGHVFTGPIDGLAYTRGYADKVGDNTPGWPHHVQSNSYTHYVQRREDKLLSENAVNHENGDKASSTVPFTVAYGSYGAWDPGNDYVDAFGYPNSDPTTKCRDLLIGKLIDAVLDQKTNWGTAFAERQQTVNLVVSSARRIAQSIHALKRGDIGHAITSLTGSSSIKASRKLRSVAGIPEQWLALQYGWKPLLQDIYGSAEELANLVASNPPACTVRVRKNTQGEPVVVAHPTGGHYTGGQWERTRCQVAGCGFLAYRLSSAFGQMVGRTGIANPYALAWETTPYSFVVDWFYPVGTFLSRLQYDNGLVFDHGWYSIKREDEWSGSVYGGVADWWPWTSTWTGGRKASKSTVLSFSREVFYSSPMPPAVRLKDPFSPTHVANALSLLATAFGRSNSAVRFSRLG